MPDPHPSWGYICTYELRMLRTLFKKLITFVHEEYFNVRITKSTLPKVLYNLVDFRSMTDRNLQCKNTNKVVLIFRTTLLKHQKVLMT